MSHKLLALLVLTAASLALPNKQGVTSERSLEAVQPSQKDVAVQDSVAEQTSLSEVELVSGDDDEYESGSDSGEDAEGESQHFFPSFAPLFSGSPLGHSRPPLFDDHPRGFSDNYRSLYGSEEGVLGSGNFGVLRGGTYYSASGDEEFNGHGGRGFGRGSNPSPPYRHGGDFFAGFRDFADITTPPKSAYSHYVVVYANPRSQVGGREGSLVANNILEQLALLDRRPPPKKSSKAKQKLSLYKEKSVVVEAQKKSKAPKELTEPLLALS